MSSFGAVKERTYTLMETGEYAFTLNDLEFSADGPYGDSLTWKFLIAPVSDPTSYFSRDDGMEKELFQYTDADIILGSRQHEWLQALTGRQFADGDDPPEDDEVIGKRMIAYLGHYTPKKGKNAGKPREKIFESSAKLLRNIAPKAVAKNVVPDRTPAPDQVTANATAEEIERATIVVQLQKLIGRAVKLDTPNHKAYVSLDLNDGSVDQLRDCCAALEAEIADALDS